MGTFEKLEATRPERKRRKAYLKHKRKNRWAIWKCFWTPPFGHVWVPWGKYSVLKSASSVP